MCLVGAGSRKSKKAEIVRVVMFNSLSEIKSHCDKVFPDSPPLKVDSDILVPPMGKPSYRLVVYLMIPPIPELVSPLRSRLEEIKEHALASGFSAKTEYGKVQPIGYHLELNIPEK